MKQREEKGVTLLVLTITIIVLLIITNITIGNLQNQLGKKNLNNLYSDIETINTKVSEYYLKNNSLPIFEENAYMNNSGQLKLLFKTNGGKEKLINVNDNNFYYVINLSKLENLTLNYGREYSNWDNNSTYEQYQDVYIINEATHQIYYPKGIKYNGKAYFTTTLPEEVEKVQGSEISDDELELTVTKSDKNYISDSDKVIIDAKINLDIGTNFMRDTLEYSWNVIQDKNTEYTRFELDTQNSAILMSKQLDNVSEYYLNIKILDNNGKEHILEEKIDNLKEMLQKGEIVLGSNVEWKDDTNEYPAIIPVGFCVVKGAGTIEEGLVISDVANDDMENTKHGNQFVWIPVNDYSKFHLIEGYYDGNLDSKLNEIREAGDTLDEAGSPMEKNSTKGTAESVAMYNSVKINHGFYIARFEAGIEETVDNFHLPEDNRKVADGKTKPLSQKGVGVWNWIPWGGLKTDIASDGLAGDDAANGIVKVARSMYTKSATCGVTSTLCYGVQWDAVMNFIDPTYEMGGCNTITSFVANSTDKGNYTRSETGNVKITGYYAEKNIYDLAGNVLEYTMEADTSRNRAYRGGNYGGSGLKTPASCRESQWGDPKNLYEGNGFRVALYVE